MATVGLDALAEHGFVLAGGYALQLHGFGDRESDDIDLFTNDLDPNHFAEAVDRLQRTYRSIGLDVEIARRAPVFARLVVEGAAKADLGVDHRWQPPVAMEVGPVLSEADAIGSKVGAVYSRLEPRDFIDVQFVLDSGRYDRDGLLEFADHREAHPLDRQMFAAQLRAGARLPDTGFVRYGATIEQIARIRRTAADWAGSLTDKQEAERGDTYAAMIPYVVPSSLDVLQGPTAGSIDLPTRLDWGPNRRYDLGSPDAAIALYSKVISEASSQADLTEYLNRDVLVALWPRLRLPRRCAELWNQAFPQLAAGTRLP
jgi:hypothetical protein